MIKIIAALCSLSFPANCHEQTVTTSDCADVSMQSCLMGAPQLAEWMKHIRPSAWQHGVAWSANTMAGELRVESNFLTEVRRQFDGRRVVNASYSESAHFDLLCDRSSIAPPVSSSAAPISEYLFCRRRTWLWAGSTDLQGRHSDFPLLKD